MELVFKDTFLPYLKKYQNNRNTLAWCIAPAGYQEAVEKFKFFDPARPNPLPQGPGGWTCNPWTPEFKAYEKAARLEYYKLLGRESWAI